MPRNLSCKVVWYPRNSQTMYKNQWVLHQNNSFYPNNFLKVLTCCMSNLLFIVYTRAGLGYSDLRYLRITNLVRKTIIENVSAVYICRIDLLTSF